MTTRTIFESDLSGEPDAITTNIGFEDSWYEVDLTESERAELEGFLSTYLAKARKVGVRIKRTDHKSDVPETTVDERERIRAWARENGYEPSSFGRIPKRIFGAYQRAHDVESETAA